MNKLISIVVACYNCESTITETLESVFNQTNHNWEVIIVDDKSKDNSVEIVSRLIDGRYNAKLIQNDHNIGLPTARYLGANQCNGEYIGFLDGDDTLNERYVESLTNFINEHEYSVIQFDHTYLKNNIPYYSDAVPSMTHSGKWDIVNDTQLTPYIGMLRKLYKTDDLLNPNLMKSMFNMRGMSVGEDTIITISMFCLYKDNIGYLKENLYNYINRPNSMMRTRSKSAIISRIRSIMYLEDIIKLENDCSDFVDRYIELQLNQLKKELGEYQFN